MVGTQAEKLEKKIKCGWKNILIVCLTLLGRLLVDVGRRLGGRGS